MEDIKQILRYGLLALVLLVTVAAGGPAGAADLFTLSTENGLEFYLLEGTIDAASLDDLLTDRSRLSLTPEGTRTDLDWNASRMLSSIGSFSAETSPTGFRGFTTSLLGRVLEINAHFDDGLRRTTTRVAQMSQTEGIQLRSLPSASSSVAWQPREGFTILSF